MASGSGLSKENLKIPESEYPVVDIVSCVRFGDMYGFFSMKEALANVKSVNLDPISDEKDVTTKIKINKPNSFIYPEDARIGRDVKGKLDTMKRYLKVHTGITDGITGIKISIKWSNKRNFYDIFASNLLIDKINEKKENDKFPLDGVTFKNLKYRDFFNLLHSRFRGSQKGADSIMREINRQLLSENNFQLLRVIGKRVPGKVSNFNRIGSTLDTVREGMFHPTDFRKLQERFVNPGTVPSFPMYIMKYSLPRFCSAEMLIKIMNTRSGSKTIYSGRRCWNITNKSLEGKKALALYPNIEVDERAMTVSNINLGLFLKKEVCNGEKYELDDNIIGYFEGGLYDVVTQETIEKNRQSEIRFFQRNFGNSMEEIVTSSFVNSVKQKFRYPRKTETLLLLREDTFTPSFAVIENRAKEYVNGFYNSFGRKSDISIPLKRELVEFILFRYVGRDGKFLIEDSSGRKEAKSIMLKIQKDVESGKDISSFLGGARVNKRDIVRLIELFTKRKEEADISKNDGIVSDAYRYGTGKSLRNFLADPNVRFGNLRGEEFPLMRSISYFVMCEYNDTCEDIFNVRDDFQSISYLKSPDSNPESYSLYYNKSNKYFTRNLR